MILKVIAAFVIGFLVCELINMSKLIKLVDQLRKIYKQSDIDAMYRNGIRYAIEQIMRMWR